MVFDIDRAMKLVRRLDFPRSCGSKEEAKAQEILAEEIRKMGLDPIYQEFVGWWIEPEHAVLELPSGRIEVEPAVPLSYLAAFPWMEDVGIEVEISGVLVEERPREASDVPLIALRKDFQPNSAVAPWAAAQILLFPPVPEFIPYAMLADPFVPSAYVPAKDVQLVRQAVGHHVTLSWKAKRGTRLFRNLVVEIPGSVLPHEVVVLGAHLDSFPGTVGASDNAAGCAVILEALRWFRNCPPECTVRFVWFTGEELDRRGSKEFVRRIAQSERIRLFINSDGGFERGTGPAWIRVSTEPLKVWVETWLQDAIAIEVGPSAGNDEEAFQEQGIPTFRVAGRSRHSAHLPADRPEEIDFDKLAVMGRLTIQAAYVAARAAGAPFVF